ncbi:hypothetical protein FRC00_001661, partial [Tulasnella sp. 408]
AVQILSVRVSQQDWDPKLLDEVVAAAVECQAFTELQRRLISITANLDSSCPASSTTVDSPADASSDSVATPPPSQQLYVNDLEVPPAPAPSLSSTVAGGSPWYSRIVSNLGGSTQPTAIVDANGSPSSSSLPIGGSSVTRPGGPSRNVSSSTTHRQHPQFQLQLQQQQQQRPEPLILSPPSPTTAGPRTNNSGSNSNNSPRTLFEEIGDDVGVDAELVKMVVKRLFISQQ